MCGSAGRRMRRPEQHQLQKHARHSRLWPMRRPTCVGACAARNYSSASRHTSTDTSSTGNAIGGSGLVALTHTPSSS